MMALLGGIAHVPLAAMLMVAEMTGNLWLLPPAMIAVGIAYLLVGRQTIYISQLQTRADAPEMIEESAVQEERREADDVTDWPRAA